MNIVRHGNKNVLHYYKKNWDHSQLHKLRRNAVWYQNLAISEKL